MVSFSPKAFSQKLPEAGKEKSSPNIVVDSISEESLRERRYFWTARAFAIVLAVSFVTNIIMVMALFSLVPLVRVQPYELVFSDKKTQTVSVQPLKAEESVLKNITGAMVRQYVTARHTITKDPDEMAFRWGDNGIVRLLSTDNTFSSFAHNISKVLNDAVSMQLTRDVVINSAMPYATQGGGEYWLVDFNLETMSPQSPTKEVVPYVAVVSVVYEPYKGSWENRLRNPIGFKVKEYGFETKQKYDARERDALQNKSR